MANTFFSHVCSRSATGALRSSSIIAECRIALGLIEFLFTVDANSFDLANLAYDHLEGTFIDAYLLAVMGIMVGGLGGAIVGSVEYCLSK